jgi:cysteinyl-tRNA synthetase
MAAHNGRHGTRKLVLRIPMALRVYNSLSRELEVFEPLEAPYVGVYVCGPTVYGDAHIGHAKSYISFDLIVRYLRFLGYQVRYVQNITDVGHLTDDADQGEDKIQKRAALEKVHPIQLAQNYERRYFEDMDALGLLRPDISPRASGHIPEQIALAQKLLETGHAYEVNGNVYFDVPSFPAYGKLSHRRLEEQAAGTRFEVRGEKRHPADFALWKKAEPNHILQWPSPWGLGYPGWHIECSCMSQKYLGETFDIHGGGLENIFPHHEDEVAQSEAAYGKPFAKYWLHNNMVTVNGQKMGKSLGNFVTLHNLREASNFDPAVPMVLRMVILQGHYRSPFDYSEAALEAGKAGYERLTRAVWEVRYSISRASPGDASDEVRKFVLQTEERFRAAMDDDFGSSGALAAMFNLVGFANDLVRNKSVTQGSLNVIDDSFRRLGGQVLGIVKEAYPEIQSRLGNLYGDKTEKLIALLVEMRKKARQEKNFALSDQIRDELAKINVKLEDGPEGTTWQIER